MCLCIRLTANGEIESFQVKNRSVTEEKKTVSVLEFQKSRNESRRKKSQRTFQLYNFPIFK